VRLSRLEGISPRPSKRAMARSGFAFSTSRNCCRTPSDAHLPASRAEVSISRSPTESRASSAAASAILLMFRTPSSTCGGSATSMAARFAGSGSSEPSVV